MSTDLNTHAQAFRSLPREEAIARLKRDYAKMMAIFESLTADEWGRFLVTHPFMGPLPTFFYPAFHVMDYGVHTWDIRYGLGEKTRKLDERTAGVLVPYMLFALLPSTVDVPSATGVDVEYGIEISGEWGGKWRASVKDCKFEAKPETGQFRRPGRCLQLRTVRFRAHRLPALPRRGGPRRLPDHRKRAPDVLYDLACLIPRTPLLDAGEVLR